MSEKDEVTYGSLVSGYMFHGFVDKAVVVFRDSKKPKLSNWNVVISGLVQNNRHEEALNLIRVMQACGCRPNTVTLSSMLPPTSYLSNLKVREEVHAYAVRNNLICLRTKGFRSSKNQCAASMQVLLFIDTHAKLSFLYQAQRDFDQAKCKSLIIWTSIISANASHKDADTSLGFFYEMLNNVVQPEQVTFTTLLTACANQCSSKSSSIG